MKNELNSIIKVLLKAGLVYKEDDKYHKLNKSSKIVKKIIKIIDRDYIKKDDILDLLSKIAYDLGYTVIFKEIGNSNKDKLNNTFVKKNTNDSVKTSQIFSEFIKTVKKNKDIIDGLKYKLDPIKDSNKGKKIEDIDNSPFTDDVKIKNVEHLINIINAVVKIKANVKSIDKGGKKVNTVSYINKDLGRMLSINFIEGNKSILISFVATLPEDIKSLSSSGIEILGKVVKSSEKMLSIKSELSSFTDGDLIGILNKFKLN